MLFAASLSSPVDLKVGLDGALYYLSRSTGHIGKIQPASNGSSPQITQQPSSLTVPAGTSATFSVSATGSPPLSYQWQKNGANTNGATASVYQSPPTTVADNNSTYRAVVTNSFGSANGNSANLNVTINTPSIATILTPVVGAKYSADTTLSFSGSGTDKGNGTLSASAFKWRIDFHHDTHNA